MAFTKTAGVEYGTPAVTLSTTAAAGSNQTAIRTDGQLIAFNTDAPENVTTGSAATGSAAFAARVDHVHSEGGAFGDVFGPASAVDDALVRFNATTGKLIQSWTSNSPTGTDDGIMTLVGQPAFSYVLSAGENNVTGAGTLYTLGGGTALTRVFDQSEEVTTAGVFTASVAGIYLLGASITFNNVSAVAAMDNYALYIVTTGGTLAKYGNLQSEKAETASLGVGMLRFSALFQMAASNTAVVKLQVFDSTDTLDLEAANTTFWGAKVA